MGLSDIWNIGRTLVTLADDLRKYHDEIKQIRSELRDLTIIVHTLFQDIKHSKETSQNERTILLLEIEKKILSIEHRLPPMKEKGKAASKRKNSKK